MRNDLATFVRFFRASACVLGSLFVLACSDDTVSPNDEQGDDPATIVIERLSARVGPAGGTLEGAEGSAFDGFRLVIPAGALDEEVEVVVSGGADPTPLAQSAERVGPQFSIEPAGLVLKSPASLSVPFDESLRQAWDVLDEECRVWYRDGDGWSNAEQTASTPTSVTVDLPKFSVAAAGVFAIAKATSCQLLNNCQAVVGPSGCLVGDTFCLTKLVAPKVGAFDTRSITTQDGFAYFLTQSGLNQFAIAKYDLLSTNGATTTSVALSATPSRAVASKGRIAVDPNGDLWLGMLGYGNVRFRPKTSATRFDTSNDGQSPTGVLYDDASGQPFRFILKALSGGGREVQTSQYSKNAGASTGTEVRILGDNGKDSFAKRIAVVSTDIGLSTSAQSFVDVCKASNTLNSTFEISREHHAVGCLNRKVFSSVLTALIDTGNVSSLAIDNGGNTFVVDSSVPEITRIDKFGGVTSVALTTAAAGSLEANKMLPMAIRYEPGLDMLVLFTRGNNSNAAFDIYLIEAFRD